MNEPADTGYAPVNGVELYWESHGSGGTPVILVHGGYGTAGLCAPVIGALAVHRRVIAIELQGHGHTRDIDRPFSYEAFGDDIGALIGHLGLERADLLGYSLGAGACLRAAIQHPSLIRKLALVSFPVRRDGWFPEVRAGFDRMDRSLFEQMRPSPMYRLYREIAPDPDAFLTLMDKTGELHRRPYDWSEDVAAITAETMLVYADADSIPPSHIAEFYARLGGGLRDATWDGSARSEARLAILPGQNHYTVFDAAESIAMIDAFLWR